MDNLNISQLSGIDSAIRSNQNLYALPSPAAIGSIATNNKKPRVTKDKK